MENTRLLVTWLVWGVSNRWQCSEWSAWTRRHTWLGHADKLLYCWLRVGPRAVSKWVTYLWSAKIRIGPLRLQAGCRRRRLNLTLVCKNTVTSTQPTFLPWRFGLHQRPSSGFSFLCLFCVVAHFFWLVNACFCCVRFCYSIPSQEIGLGNICEMTCFVWSGT